jgi:hypothetical protein
MIESMLKCRCWRKATGPSDRLGVCFEDGRRSESKSDEPSHISFECLATHKDEGDEKGFLIIMN